MPSTQALPPRDRQVLDALEGDGSVSFQGLRRLLGLHPQALSRSLKRLRQDGFVVTDGTGYRLAHPAVVDGHGDGLPVDTEAGKALLPPIPLERSATLAAVLLATPDAVRLVEQNLSGRWFRALRWLGKARSGRVTVLAWLVEPDGVVIRLVLDGHHARIEVAEEARDDPAVHGGVHALLPAVSQALTRGVDRPSGARMRPAGPFLLA